MGFKITRKDRGMKAAKATLLAAHGKHVIKVGLVGAAARAAHPKANMSIAELGAIHEFGLAEPRVPMRSFIRQYFDQNQTELQVELRHNGVMVLKGLRSPAAALGAVGRHASDGMRKFLLAGEVSPELAEATIRRKGHDTPLKDTGALAAALSWEKV